MKYLQKIIDFILGLIGLLFFIILFPFFAYIIIQNTLITGVLVGFMLFASISLFSIQLRILELPKFSLFNKKKFIKSIFIIPFIVGFISNQYNITLNSDNFILINNWIEQQITVIPNIDNQIVLDYFKLIFKILPSAIATVYFIKLFIFHFLTLGLFL